MADNEQKNMCLACFEVSRQFSFSIRIDNTSLIKISGDSTTYFLYSVYI